jgi:diguanylate cyclase (GGDEF)-like protein
MAEAPRVIRLPDVPVDGDEPLLARTPEDRLGVERMSIGPGITGPLALACFYLIGGLLTLASLPLGRGAVDAGGVLTIGTAAVLSGVLIVGLRDHLSTTSCHVLVALGSLMIGTAMVAGDGGAATATYSAFFIWVAVYAALFFDARPAVGQLSWAGTVHVIALLLVDDVAVLMQTLVLFGTVTATALVVGALVRQVRTVAATDPLTGLPNRRSFDEHVELALARAVRHGRPVALLALDLDGFKQVNDAHGHAAGDRLLIAAGKTWTALLRSGELLARSGGDEFVVLLPDTDDVGARNVAARLRGSTPPPLGVSIGVAISTGGESARQLMRRADVELYRDKYRDRAPAR